jgi:hypothetical protein
MAIQTDINLIINAIFQGEDLNKFRGILAEIIARSNELQQVNQDSAQEQVSNSSRITQAQRQVLQALEDVQAAQSLLAESPEDQRAEALELLQQEYRRFGQAIQQVERLEEQQSNQQLADIRKLQAELAKLAAKKRELESSSNRSSTQQNELSTVNAQIEGLQRRITALRGTQQAASQTTQEQANSFGRLRDVVGLISERLQNLGGQLPGIGGGLSTIGSGLGELAAAAGPVAAITVGIAALGAAGIITLKEISNLTLGVKDLAKERGELEQFAGIGREISATLQTAGLAINATLGDLKDGLAQLKQAQKEALLGNEEIKEALNGLGVVDFTSAEAALEQINAKLKSSGDLAKGLAVEFSRVFGEEGGRQFSEIALKLDEAKQRAKEFGLVLSGETVEQAAKLQSVLADIQAQLDGASIIVGSRFLDAFTELGQAVSDVITQLRNDEAFTGALEQASILVDGIVRNGLPKLVTLLGEVVAVAGKIAGLVSTIEILGEAFGIFPKLALGATQFKESTKGIPESVKTISDEVKGLGRSSVTATEAIKLLENQLSKIEKRQQIELSINSESIKKQIVDIEELERKGLVTAIEAARQKNDLLQKEVDNRLNAARQNLDFAQNEIRAKITEEQERISRARVVEAKILAEKQKAQEEGNTKAVESLDRQLVTTQAKIGASLAVIQGLQQKFGEKRLELQEKLTKTEIELDNQKLQAKRNIEEAITKDKQTTTSKILEEETRLVNETKKLFEQGAISKIESENRITQIQIAAQEQRLQAAREALTKFDREQIQQNVANANLRKQLETEVNNESIKLTEQRLNQEKNLEQQFVNQRLQNLEAESIRRQSLLERDVAFLRSQNREGEAQIFIVQNLVAQADEKLKKEELTLASLRNENATLEQQKIQREKIDAAQKEALSARLQAAQKILEVTSAENKAVEALADKNNSLTGILEKQAGKIQSIKETFDATTASVEEIRKRIADLRADAEDLLLKSQAAVAARIDAALSFIDAAEALERKLNERLIQESLEAERLKAEQAIAERQRAAQEALKLVQQELKEEAKLLEESKEKRRKIKDDIAENERKRDSEITDLKKKQQEQLDDFDEQQKEKEQKRADQQHQSLLEKEDDFQEQLANLRNQVKEQALEDEEKFLDERAKLELQLNEALEQASSGDDDGTRKNAQAKADDLRNQISALDERENQRKERQSRKDDEINKAQQSASERIKNAKSAEEVEQIEKELSIQIEGIDKKFKNEEEYEQKLAGFRGKVSQETLDKIKANFEAQQALAEQNAADRIAAERKKFDLLKAAREKAEAEEKEAAEKRRQELIENQKKELDDRNKAFDEKKKQLEQALADERKSYKKHLEELRTKTAESLAAIASSFTDGGKAAEEFFTKFATNLGLTGKAIDEVLNKLKQFKQETQNAQQQLNNAGSNNTSPGNPLGGSTSNQNNNNGGPLTGSPSNTSGATGTIGNNIIAAPQQSNGNNSNPNSGANTNNNSNPTSNSSSSNSSNSNASPNSQNTANQSKSSDSKGNGSYPTIPDEIKTGDEYKALVLQILEVLLKKAGVKNVNDPGSGDIFLKGKKGNLLEAEARQLGAKALRAYGLTVLRANPSIKEKADEVYAKQINGVFAGGTENSVISILVTIDFKDGKGFTNLKSNRKRHANFADQVIAIVEKFRSTGKLKGDSTKDVGGIIPIDPGSIGGLGGDKGNGGFGPRDKPEIPNVPPPSNGNDLSDEEKAFFANREKDTQNGDGEGASKKGFVAVAPDAAVGGPPKKPGQATNNQSKPSNQAPTTNNANNQTESPDSINNSTSQAINQNNNSQVTVNLQVQGFLGDNKTVNQLKELFSNLMSEQNQVNQDRLRQLNGANLARRG